MVGRRLFCDPPGHSLAWQGGGDVWRGARVAQGLPRPLARAARCVQPAPVCCFMLSCGGCISHHGRGPHIGGRCCCPTACHCWVRPPSRHTCNPLPQQARAACTLQLLPSVAQVWLLVPPTPPQQARFQSKRTCPPASVRLRSGWRHGGTWLPRRVGAHTRVNGFRLGRGGMSRRGCRLAAPV